MNKPIKILIDNSSNKAFLNANILFLKKIKENYDFFMKDYNESQKKWENTNILEFINPEKLKYSSPITIFDAKWGMGKTYFFEKLIENCFLNNKNKIDLKEYGFKRIFLLDLWEYINNKEMINDIVFDIYKKLIPKSTSIKNILKNIIKKGISVTSVFLGNLFTNGNLGLSVELDNEINKDIDAIKKDLESIEPTIIIFDNLERLENISIEIIKLIQKISNIKNLLIILPMNKEQFYMNNISGESKIDKYITLGKYFEFKQEYSNILLNKGVDPNYIELTNNLLKIPHNGYVLSIRNLEKKINSESLNNNFEKSKYDGMKYLNNNLWECKNEIKNIFKKDIDIICKFIISIINLFDGWQVKNNSSLSNFNYQHFQNKWNNYQLSESLINEINNIFRFNNLDYQDKINTKLNICFKQILENNNLILLIDEMDKSINSLKKNINLINNNINNFSKQILEYQNDIQNIEEDIVKLNSSILKLEELGPDTKQKDVIEKSNLKIKLQYFSEAKEQKNKKISEINSNINKNNKELEEINELIKNLNYFQSRITEFISLYKNIILDFKEKNDLFFLLREYQDIIKSYLINNDWNVIVDKIFSYYFGDN